MLRRRARSLVRLPFGDAHLPKVQTVKGASLLPGERRQKPWSQKAFDRTLGYPGLKGLVNRCAMPSRILVRVNEETTVRFLTFVQQMICPRWKVVGLLNGKGGLVEVQKARRERGAATAGEGPSPLSQKPCFEQSTGFCKYGSGCEFQHVEEHERAKEGKPLSCAGKLLAASHRQMQEKERSQWAWRHLVFVPLLCKEGKEETARTWHPRVPALRTLP